MSIRAYPLEINQIGDEDIIPLFYSGVIFSNFFSKYNFAG